MEGIIITVAILAIAIFALRGFDRISGRGPKQVSDGIERAEKRRSPAEELQAATEHRSSEHREMDESNGDGEGDQPQRVPCPECAELIMPAARKCRFCGAHLDGAE